MKYQVCAWLGMAMLLSTACDKDWDQSGCTDPIAINYEPRALHDDGTCAYNKAEQVIWTNGQRGGWNGDAFQGAFRHEVCDGIALDLTHTIDSTSTYQSLLLSTAGGNRHMSFFSIINERDARDFAEGTLRFDARIVESGAPAYIDLFISGKNIVSNECAPFRRSGTVEISTHSLNDSVFVPVTIPLRHFDKIMMARVEVVCGFVFEGERNTGIEIDNLRWSANRDPDPLPIPDQDPVDEAPPTEIAPPDTTTGG